MAKKKVRRIKFNTNFYELGQVKFQKGFHYPATPETETRVLAGDAEPIDVDMDEKTAADEQAAADRELAGEVKATRDAEAEADRKDAPAAGAPAAAPAASE